MSKLIALLLSLTTALPAYGGQSAVVSNASVFTGGYVPRNYVSNPTPLATGTNGWTKSGAGATFSRDTTSGNQIDGVASFAFDASASTDYVVTNGWTIADNIKGGNCEARILTKGDATLYQLQVYQGTVLVAYATLPSSTTFTPTSLNYTCGDASQQTTVRVASTSASAAAINFGRVYAGEVTNISQVSQAQIVGTATWAPTTSCLWTTNSTTFTNFPVGASCPTPTVDGAVAAPATKVPGVLIPNYAPGDYLILATGPFARTNVDQYPYFRFSDGTNVSTEGSAYASGAIYIQGSTLIGRIKNLTAQTNVTLQIQAKVSVGTASAFLDGQTYPTTIIIYRYPLTSEQAYSANVVRTPTIQTFTSGSGTYTKPANATYIKVRMVGGGAGGNGSGNATTYGVGGAGGNTTFGSSLLVANGAGVNSLQNAGTPGTASLGTGPVGTAFSGAYGQGSGFSVATSAGIPGGMGAATPFGGGGGGGYANASGGNAAPANSGAGGGGAGFVFVSAATGFSGVGGSAGGYVDAIIPNPASTYSYSVGTGGSGGTAGTNGAAGGSGGAGYIEVTEYYGNNAPILVGSVTSNSTGAERVERVRTTSAGCATTPCTIDTQSGSWVTSVSRASTGHYSINIASGIFSATPVCTCSILRSASGQFGVCMVSESSATLVNLEIYTMSSTSVDVNDRMDVICMGPR